MWLSWKEIFFPAGRMCCGARGVIPCSRPVICFTPVLISPVINDLVLTQSDLLPLPVLLDKRLAGERCFRSDLQVVTRATYTCFSWCTVHLAARQDLQFHPSQGAKKELEGGGCTREVAACMCFSVLWLIWYQLPFDGNARPEALCMFVL